MINFDLNAKYIIATIIKNDNDEIFEIIKKNNIFGKIKETNKSKR